MNNVNLWRCFPLILFAKLPSRFPRILDFQQPNMYLPHLKFFSLYGTVTVVNLNSLLCGMMLAWPFLLSMSNDNPLGIPVSSAQVSWITSLAPLGGFAGATFTSLITEKLGKKIALASLCLPNIVAALTAAFGDNIWYFYFSRVFAGMSIYGGISVGAVYLGEIAESRHRGLLYSTTSIFLNLGSLLSYCIAPYTTVQVFNLILLGVTLVCLVTTLTVIVESPYFLVKNHQLEQAQRVLEVLRGASAQKEILSIQSELSGEIFKTKAARKALARSLIVTAIQPLSGIAVIYAYTQPIFNKAGSLLSPELSAILVGVTQLVTACFTAFGVDTLGRKNMLALSSSALAFTLATLATFFRFQALDSDSTTVIDWLPSVCVTLFFVFFNCGLAGIPFLYMSEMLPPNVKSIGTGAVTANFCLISFLVGYFYEGLVDRIGISGSFYLFAGTLMSFAMYVMTGLFETKRKSLREIQLRLSRSKRSKNAF